MTGSLGLDWAILIVSIFNTILLFWLGLMVLLNADRRTWGVWLSSGAMLLGGVFFLSHTAIVGYSPILDQPDIEIWWRAGWLPITCLPFAWYTVMLWYNGYWEPDSTLRKRHKLWFRLTMAWAIIFLVMLVFTHPLPSVSQILQFDFQAAPAFYGIPILILVYPVYTVLCTGLTLDVLRWPGPSRRVLAEQARLRAWPWLGAASLVLFAVGLLVGGTVFWVITLARGGIYETEMASAIGILDLIIASLVGATILLVGQAIVAYEVFTGKTLPRRGLRWSWRRAILLAGGFSLAASLAIVLESRPVNILLITVLVVAIFYALLSWRYFEERESVMTSLRPFLTSQDLYQELVAQPDSETDRRDEKSSINGVFRALCNDVLDTKLATLIPLGPMAPLGARLVYPDDTLTHLPSLEGLGLSPLDRTTTWIELENGQYEGASWAIPLHGPRGLLGVLFLGEKRDNGLYTQEEIEIAKLAGERLLDAQASAAIARRLMMLQRQRTSESQVLDQQARRVLHDEILPQLHALMLNLSDNGQPADREALTAALAEVHRHLANLLRDLPSSFAPQVSRLGLAEALALLVNQEHRSAFDQVSFEITPGAEAHLPEIPLLSCEVVYYAVREAVRNAARYGRGGEPDKVLRLDLEVDWETGLLVTVSDNGVGLIENLDKERNAGNGQGLELHSTLLAVLGGTLAVYQTPGGGVTVTIRLPQSY